MEISKILKFIWLISFLGVAAVLFYTYASLPEMVAYAGDISTSLDYVGKEFFFYFFLVVIAFSNAFIYFMAARGIGSRSLSASRFHRVVAWEYGLAVVVNLFLLISMLFLMIFNSGEKFEYSNFGYLVYFSLVLVIVWVISLPFVIYSARIRV